MNVFLRRSIAFFAALILICLLPVFSYAQSKGKVNCSALNLRASNSAKSDVIKTLHSGDKVTIVGKKGDWYKVTYGKKTGYVLKKYITTEKSSETKSSDKNKNSKKDSGKIKSMSDIGSAPKKTLKSGSSGKDVKKLQQALKLKGYYKGDITGKYDSATKSAVKKYQKKVGLTADGIANTKTINKLWGKSTTEKNDSGEKIKTERLNWFDNVYKIPKGATFQVKDCKTGKVFTVKRWSGGNHIDAEPYKASDTKTIKSIYGGVSWKRRAILVKYNGHVYAASMNFFPHGTQTIYNNNFQGHFCIHFYKSKTHGTKRVDEEHQNQVARAMKYTW